MKKIFYLFFFVSSVSIGQESDELLKALFDDEPIVEKSLLPDKMIYTQSVLWGKKTAYFEKWVFQNYLLTKERKNSMLEI